MTYHEAVRLFEQQYVMAAVRRWNGNQAKAARELGLHRNSVRRIIEQSRAEVDAILSARAEALRKLRRARERERYYRRRDLQKAMREMERTAALAEDMRESKRLLNELINEREGFPKGSRPLDRMNAIKPADRRSA